ncbi:hypothetical protein ACSTD9_22245, partial [Vibrio vulnificus]
VAFLVCREFCGESGLRKVCLGGIHPLTQRYVEKILQVLGYAWRKFRLQQCFKQGYKFCDNSSQKGSTQKFC